MSNSLINTPQVGQRWMADTDSSLGLGIVTDCDKRSLTIDFPAVDESRRYALDNAPVTRVAFAVGDTIHTIDEQQYVVAAVEVVNHLLIYMTDEGEPIPETRLASTVELNHPVKRLLAGQLDKPMWFDLRAKLSKSYHRWVQADVLGLQGARISLTPHQLYVAEAASKLDRVRVLLADEVGLGKTIEAGLILQRLLLQERVQHVLILVPEALRVQWFVELLRCFNIHAVLWEEGVDPSEPRIFIAAHSVFTHQPEFADISWDMVIVDEAHHFDLLDSESQETQIAAQRLQTIGQACEHLLLLSATPERMGLEQHFSRLALLDHSRFHHFADFQQQYDNYEALADDLEQLLASETLEPEQRQKFTQLLPQLDQVDADKPEDIINLLLDCHGTGRVVFRNTRSAISGFPERQLVVHDTQTGDAALEWLASFVKEHATEKVLFIAHEKDTVLDIREWLYRKTGIDCPVFHEEMSLVERDRAAAYFADNDEGAPLLLCSEIGSEGRNFQFCHHLICWDLPEHPDVLEQRIGRLDRIGQTQTIRVHTCIRDESQRQRLHWYQQVLNCIEQTNPAAGIMHDRWYQAYLDDPQATGDKVKQETQAWLNQLQNGRDRLLEMNSCRQPRADQLVESVLQFERDNNPEALLTMATDLLNIHMESLDDTRFSLIPSDQMLVPMIPGIPPEGCEITFDRATATAREDVQFITWDHPLMQGLAELIATSELGVATVALLPNKSLKPGILFYEAIFKLTIKHPQAKSASQYLPDSLLRTVVTKGNPKNLDSALPQHTLASIIENASKPIRKAVVKDYQQDIQALSEQAQDLAKQAMAAVTEQALDDLGQHRQLEIARLEQLQQHNAHIHSEDIEQQQQRFDALAKAIGECCQLEVEAVRLLVTFKP